MVSRVRPGRHSHGKRDGGPHGQRSIVGVRIAGVSNGVAAPERAALSPTPLPLTAGGLSAQVSRNAPPALPGGYTAGDTVFYTGVSETLSSWNKLVHGQQGEVMGPGTSSKRTAGMGVAVRFPNNKASIGCFLFEVRRLHAAHAVPPPHALSSTTVSMLHRDHASS